MSALREVIRAPPGGSPVNMQKAVKAGGEESNRKPGWHLIVRVLGKFGHVVHKSSSAVLLVVFRLRA